VLCVTCRTAVIFRPTQLHTKLEPAEVEFSGDFSLGNLREWVNKNMYVFTAVNQSVSKNCPLLNEIPYSDVTVFYFKISIGRVVIEL